MSTKQSITEIGIPSRKKMKANLSSPESAIDQSSLQALVEVSDVYSKLAGNVRKRIAAGATVEPGPLKLDLDALRSRVPLIAGTV